MKTVLKYPGSKWSSADWIIDNFPDEYEKMTYLEPYFGSGAIFFSKKRSKIETINDIDDNVVNLFRVIRQNPLELMRAINLTPWSRSEYELSYNQTEDGVEKARRFMVRCWQAIGTKTSDITGWSNNIKPVDTGSSRWSRLEKSILKTAKRLKHDGMNIVQIESMPAVELIKRYKKEYVFIYLDPPYLLSTRSGRIYKCEMTEVEHIKLLETIKEHPGPVMISGYDSDIYNECLKGWFTDTKPTKCEMGKDATEKIWMNYKPKPKQLRMDI